MLGTNIEKGKGEMVSVDQALPGRKEPIIVPEQHFVNGKPLKGPFPVGIEQAMFALGCFWGAERLFWQQPGVYSTAVGYAGGYTPNPSYEEVCSGRTGHAEVVLVAYNSAEISYENLLKLFWEAHNPTQGMRQGNDIGTQYRSAIYCYDQQQFELAEQSRKQYQQALAGKGLGEITTEIEIATELYYAEPYHQQYLAKNPNGYCGLKGTGVSCAII